MKKHGNCKRFRESCFLFKRLGEAIFTLVGSYNREPTGALTPIRLKYTVYQLVIGNAIIRRVSEGMLVGDRQAQSEMLVKLCKPSVCRPDVKLKLATSVMGV